MKNIKVFLCLLAVIAISIGINANALSEQSISKMQIILPVHKTDESGKGLEGAIFTLKDLNNTISISSSDEKNGDYLIQSSKESVDVLDDIINSLPYNYKEVITGIKSWEDVKNLQNRDDMIAGFANEMNASCIFLIPLKLEESVAPAGYQKQDYIVTGIVFFQFNNMNFDENRESIEARSEYYDGFYDNAIDVKATLVVMELPLFFPGYFNYDSSKDYGIVYKDIMIKIFDLEDSVNEEEINEDSYEELMNSFNKELEKFGYNTKDVECPDYNQPSTSPVPKPEPKRENFEDIQFAVNYSNYCYYGGGGLRRETEARFDDSISNCYCVIQLKNKKENIIVNPETASTLGIISLIILGSIGFITAKKLRKNN